MEDFADIVETVRGNATEKLGQEVAKVDGDNPHIELYLQSPVQVSRNEFLRQLNGNLEQERGLAFSFLDAENVDVDGQNAVKYRLRVNELEDNPL